MAKKKRKTNPHEASVALVNSEARTTETTEVIEATEVTETTEVTEVNSFPPPMVEALSHKAKRCFKEVGLNVQWVHLLEGEDIVRRSFSGQTFAENILAYITKMVSEEIIKKADSTMVVPINCSGKTGLSITDKILKAQNKLDVRGTTTSSFMMMTPSAFAIFSRDSREAHLAISPVGSQGLVVNLANFYIMTSELLSENLGIRSALPYEYPIKSLAVYYHPSALQIMIGSVELDAENQVQVSISVKVVDNNKCGFIELEV